MQVTHYADYSVVSYTVKEAMAKISSEKEALAVADHVHMTGGAYALVLSKDAAVALSATFDTSIPAGNTIFMVEELFKGFSDEEVEAVRCHELGHIRLGHLKNIDPTEVVNGIVANVQIELEADAYAASLCGKEAVRGFLIKAMRLCAKRQAKISTLTADVKTQEECYEVLLTDSNFKRRLDALA